MTRSGLFRHIQVVKKVRSALLAAFILGFLLFSLPSPEQLLTAAAAQTGGPATTIPFPDRMVAEQPDLRLAVLGDVGTGDANEWHTAGLVAESGAHDPFDGLVLLGDNAYPDGDPELLEETVFEPFAPVLASGAELLPVLGNHDVQDGHGDAHAAALGMPARWYAHDFGELLLVALDSTQPRNESQLAWLDQTLAAAIEPWIVVALHHPPYSAGSHGSDLSVRRVLSGIFEQYGVDLVLAGHDHDYQRSVPINGVTYVVSGGAAKLRPNGEADFTAASFSTLHYTELALYGDRLELRAINEDGVFDMVDLSSTQDPLVVAAASPGDGRLGLMAIVIGLLGMLVANAALLLAPVAVARVASTRLNRVATFSLVVLTAGVAYSLLLMV
jgi:hypothetical protein